MKKRNYLYMIELFGRVITFGWFGYANNQKIKVWVR